MQQRRLGPGDVLDDYCPRERRVTDHAIVAMIDDTIQQTRCVVCDAEHEYKQAKVPPQRKKKAPALFNQVLDGLKAPARPPHVPESATDEPEVIQQHEPVAVAAVEDVPVAAVAAVAAVAVQPIESEVVVAAAAVMAVADPDDDAQPTEPVEGPLFRRQLIRAALPRPEGTTPPARVIPEFTIRQPMGRNRHGGGGGGRRRAGGQGQGQGFNGPMVSARMDTDVPVAATGALAARVVTAVTAIMAGPTRREARVAVAIAAAVLAAAKNVNPLNALGRRCHQRGRYRLCPLASGYSAAGNQHIRELRG
jgi:hypothetical protein